MPKRWFIRRFVLWELLRLFIRGFFLRIYLKVILKIATEFFRWYPQKIEDLPKQICKISIIRFDTDSSRNSFWNSHKIFFNNSTKGSCKDLFWKFIEYLFKDSTKKSSKMCSRIPLEISSEILPENSQNPSYFFDESSMNALIVLMIFRNSSKK